MARKGKPVLDRSWTPVRRGHVYCSPACGAKCLYTDYVEARRTAQMMAEALGPGWKPQVWENMGWFFRVERGPLGVRRQEDAPVARRYQCANWDDQLLGWTQGEGRTPRAAVAACVLALRAKFRAAERSMESINQAGRGSMR